MERSFRQTKAILLRSFDKRLVGFRSMQRSRSLVRLIVLYMIIISEQSLSQLNDSSTILVIPHVWLVSNGDVQAKLCFKIQPWMALCAQAERSSVISMTKEKADELTRLQSRDINSLQDSQPRITVHSEQRGKQHETYPSIHSSP